MELTKKAINEGKCVVIGLQSTGDSRTKTEVFRHHESSEENQEENQGMNQRSVSYRYSLCEWVCIITKSDSISVVRESIPYCGDS